MPREATVDELAKFRSDGQAAQLFAAFFPGHVIYTAILASVPSTTDQVAVITFTSGSGTLANVKKDMSLRVGSTAGGQELGYARIRKTPIAGTFYIGEQSIIDWNGAATVYLTVVDDYDLFAKHVRIDGTTIKMDYDVVFSNQHTVFTPVPVLGPIVSVAELIEGTADIQVGPEDGYHSWVIGSTITTHAWTSPSGDISFNNATAESPIVTVTAPGWHLIYDTVTAANTKTRQGVRYVYAYDKDNPPMTVFQLADNVEDNKTGGSNFSLSFQQNASLSEIPDRALCVLFAKDYYGIDAEREQVSIGAVAGRENILFVGRVIAESLSYDDESHTAQIDIEGYQELMKRINGFPAGLRFKITPAKWTDMPGMTVDKALWHLLEWHTTAITIMDFNRTGDTRKTAQAFSPFASIWEQMQEFAQKQILANSFVDHLGRLFFQIDPLMLMPDDRTYPVVMEIFDSDLTGRVDLPREVLSEVGQVDSSGVVVDNGGNGKGLRSLSPGHIPDRTGGIDVLDRLLLENQAQSKEIAGLEFARRNNPYKPMRVKLRANNRLLTVFPNQAVTYTIAADKNPRGFEITKNWIPRQRKLNYDPETGALDVELVLEAETTPMLAVKAAIPGSGDYSLPPSPSLPPIPLPPIILPGGNPPTSEGGPQSVLVHSTNAGLLRCDNFNAGANEQEWYTVNGGLPTGDYQTINRIVICPNGAIYVARIHAGFSGAGAFIYRAPSVGAEFELIEDYTSITTKFGHAGSGTGLVNNINCNRLAPESVGYIIGDLATIKCYYGSAGAFALKDQTMTGIGVHSTLSYGNGKWVVSGGASFIGKLYQLAADLTAPVLKLKTPDDLKGDQWSHVRISTTGDMYLFRNLDDNMLAKVLDNGASVTQDIGDDYVPAHTSVDEESIFCVNPNGQRICTIRATTGKGMSSDYGATLVDIANLPFVGGIWRFAWCGDDDMWIAVSSYIYFTDDFWASAPMDKRGNILELDPILSLDNVKVLIY